ncbi:MAG: ImmA/IrrE family metallo-endopeptidase [Oscillospiraceae bacterium]|nr:ImmA/IrrE family metallo-endopeptidase [Oscillospiraceae bacterium]
MIRIKITRIDEQNDNTPILYNREIDEYAHVVLKDYKPQLLREPGAINFEHFLESYLGVTLIFRDIYYEDPERPIFAVTAFRDGTLKVFDRKNNRIANIIVRANTVILDNIVMEPGREGLALFTGLHEGGHILIHSGVYDTFRVGQVCCRRENVENNGGKWQQRTAVEWREHQADYFAAALAMPNATFMPFVNHFLRENGIWKNCIVLGYDEDMDIFAQELLPERISEVYGVSKRAASIKLKKSGFVADMQPYQKWEEKKIYNDFNVY